MRKTRKTYLIRQQLISEIDRIAAKERIGKSDLVCYVLHHGLQSLACGALHLPIKEVTVRRILREETTGTSSD